MRCHLTIPPSISPPVSSSRALEEHLKAWPLSCYYTIWCLLQLTLVKPGEACQLCHHCPFYVSQHSLHTSALADTPQMTYCHCVKREWGVTDELEHPSSWWKRGEKTRGKKVFMVKNLCVCTYFFQWACITPQTPQLVVLLESKIKI